MCPLVDINITEWIPVESCAFKLFKGVLDTPIPALRGGRRFWKGVSFFARCM